MPLQPDLLIHALRHFNQNGLTPIAYFAKEGQDERVQQLIDLDCGRFEEAAYGYTLAGELRKAQDLLRHPDLGGAKELVHKGMLRGAAHTGRLDALYELLPELRNRYPGAEVRGLSERGALAELGRLVNRNLKLYSDAIEGFATTAQTEALVDHLKYPGYHGHAILKAAEAGHATLVNELLASSAVAPNAERRTMYSERDKIAYQALLNNALKGYVRGCHFDEALAMIEQGAKIEHAQSELPSSASLDELHAVESLTFETLGELIGDVPRERPAQEL